jgi:hypothetical protein
VFPEKVLSFFLPSWKDEDGKDRRNSLSRKKLFLEYFNHFLLSHEVTKFAIEACGAHDVVVDPMVVATAWLAKQKTVIPEAKSFEPRFSDLTKIFRS